MYDDYDSESEGFEFPEQINPAHVMSLESLRDKALVLFGEFIEQASGGINPQANVATLEEKAQFLTIDETEQIVREHSAADNGEMMAVGGNTPQAAAEKITQLMRALLARIMSNVIALGVKEGYVDSCFDDENDAFAFSVSAAGMELIKRHREFFNDPPENYADFFADNDN